jgi:pyrroloquinoline quinone (PQQ) biosynthesis protein C
MFSRVAFRGNNFGRIANAFRPQNAFRPAFAQSFQFREQSNEASSSITFIKPEDVPDELKDRFSRVQAVTDNHDFWNNKIFQACNNGTFSRDDWRKFYAQYYLYSKNFTRYLAGLMYRMEDDKLRAALTENLWEEGGGQELSKRHSQLFRNFLTNSLDLVPEEIKFEGATTTFVNNYLEGSCNPNGLYSAAFLCLGTEAIVARMYTELCKGMEAAQFQEKELEFFHLHMECDDEHAFTLAEIMFSYRNDSDWEEVATDSTSTALALRRDWFDLLHDNIVATRS